MVPRSWFSVVPVGEGCPGLVPWGGGATRSPLAFLCTGRSKSEFRFILEVPSTLQLCLQYFLLRRCLIW